MGGGPGKWGRAVSVSTTTMAQEQRAQEVVVKDMVTYLYLDISKSKVLDLYAVGAKSQEDKTMCMTVPFVHQIKIHGQDGVPVKAWAHFDDGAMKEAMTTKMFKESRGELGEVQPLWMHL